MPLLLVGANGADASDRGAENYVAGRLDSAAAQQRWFDDHGRMCLAAV